MKDERPFITLQMPSILPGPERLILMDIPKPDKKTKSGLILPGYMKQQRGRKPEEINPTANRTLVVVAIGVEVVKKYALPKRVFINKDKGYQEIYKDTNIEIGDIAILSEAFAPVEIEENGTTYYQVYYQDVCGYSKTLHDYYHVGISFDPRYMYKYPGMNWKNVVMKNDLMEKENEKAKEVAPNDNGVAAQPAE